MAAWEFRENEPQINADERRFYSVTDLISFFVDSLFFVTDFGAILCKERKAQPQCRTRITRIGRIFTDSCVSVSSVQSVFYHVCFSLKKQATETEVSAFICVHPRFLKIAPAMQGTNGEAE